VVDSRPFIDIAVFFALPLAALVPFSFRHRPDGARGSAWITKSVLAGGGIILTMTAILVSFALYWNLTKVRGFDSAGAKAAFIERLLIQPSEIGWASFQRVFINEQYSERRAYDFLFERPIVPGRNTTPQYLMSESIGEPRATEHLAAGFQFAGGFPEIVFELFGPLYGWPLFLIAGWICAALSAIMIRSVLCGHYLTAGLSFYVLFGFYVMYIGGQVNFAAVVTYWAKLGLFALALVLEGPLQSKGIELLPWRLTPFVASVKARFSRSKQIP
jgi:Family of unknown function (DUF6418)